ncbi:MAG: hypothetical protein QOF98_1500, partial [Streptomyces sp.]|nr:hypothetical protein [Streptomyces sp.]
VDEDIPHGRWPEMETTSIGSGYITLNAFGPDGQGVCGHVKYWNFEIGKPVTATGGGGSEPPSSSEPTPQTGGTGPADATTAPTGDLADTGSSAALPVIGLMGGAAVALGAGAVYAVRRRRAGTDAA